MSNENLSSIDSQLTIIGYANNISNENTQNIDLLMRKFQSAKRYSRERILNDSLARKDCVENTKILFIPNSRYMRDAYMEAEANISSQKELLPMYIEQDKNKLNILKKDICNTQEIISKINIKLKSETNLEKVEKLNQKLCKNAEKLKSYNKKLKKLDYSLKSLEEHIQNDTVPKVIDGSRQLLKKLNKGYITKSEWRDKRSNAFYSRGEKSKGGNENTRLTYLKGNEFNLAILNPFEKKKGTRINITVEFCEKFTIPICNYLQTSEAYSVRVIRQNGTYEVHVSFENKHMFEIEFTNGCAGIDINPDNISVSITHKNGNFRTSKVFWMCDLNTVSANKRNYIINETVALAIDYIKSYGIKHLAIERLNFKKKKSKSASFNRMSHNFAFREISKAIVSKCIKEKVGLIEIDAYYSSLIGGLKYKKQLGLSDHQAAALVLARRAMNLNEKVPKQIMLELFAKEAENGLILSNLFKHWQVVGDWFNELREKASKNKNTKKLYKGWVLDDYINFSKVI